MNAQTIIVLIILIIALIGYSYYFIKLPNKQRISNVKEWLKYAVIEAEKALGTGTGQLKLHYVYDLAVKQFSWLAGLIPFETFSTWVDEALEWMNKQLEENQAAAEYVEN
jgi:hypothetical protein